MPVQTRIIKDKLKDNLYYNFQSLLKIIPANHTSYTTHNFYKYPTTFIPQYPNIFIKNLSKVGEKVLDPMCGIGTTLIESCLLKRRGLGMEINPIAQLISKVVTTPMSESELRKEKNALITALINKFSDKNLKNDIIIPSERDFPNINLWFRKDTIIELLTIKNTVDTLFKDKNDDYRDFSLAVLASIVKSVSNADPRDLMPERDKNMLIRPRQEVLKIFISALEKKSKKLLEFSKRVNFEKRSKIIGTDARKIPLKDESLDLVITSPPYAYAIDYPRVTQLATMLLLMPHKDFLIHKRMYVGTDRISFKEDVGSFNNFEFAEKEIYSVLQKDRKCGLILYKYLKDMCQITKQIKKVLKKEGHLVYIIGDSTIRKTHFAMSRTLENICTNVGFELERIFRRPYYVRRMPQKRAKQSAITKEDVFLIMKKKGE